MTIPRTEFSVNYTLEGPISARVVTLSHSQAADLSMWAPQMSALTTLADSCRVEGWRSRRCARLQPPPDRTARTDSPYAARVRARAELRRPHGRVRE
jgi:hypothetical protein